MHAIKSSSTNKYKLSKLSKEGEDAVCTKAECVVKSWRNSWEELLVLDILNHLSHIKEGIHIQTQRGGNWYTRTNLKEAVSGVSLPEPEGSILRYVHVGGLHHPLIDPVKQTQTAISKGSVIPLFHFLPYAGGLGPLSPSVNSFPQVCTENHMLSVINKLSLSASFIVPLEGLQTQIASPLCKASICVMWVLPTSRPF